MQRLAVAEEQYDTGLRKLTATAKQIATLQRQVRSIIWRQNAPPSPKARKLVMPI